MKINANYLNLEESYLFATVERKVSEYKAAHPDKKVISLGIGDVTLPLPPVAVAAMQEAAAELGKKETFRGYGPYRGYRFLTEALQKQYAARGVAVEEEEIFASEGAKSDLGNILDLFARDNRVLVPDPVYPVYVDTNVMDGREIGFVDGTAENGFLPPPPAERADLIYICSPNNPTGAVYDRAGLKAWVDYALKWGAVILFDAAYERFVADPALPRSIFEIEGARECAIEFGSFSKTAGFTGVRCGYTVVPKALVREGSSLNKLWLRRQSTKYNGLSYVVQRGAAAVLTPEGQEQIDRNIAYYRENARLMAEALEKMGVWFTGGKNSPYLFFDCGGDSWSFFDRLLEEGQVVGTPGAGFGRNCKNFFRLTAFGDRDNTLEAVERLKRVLG